MSQEANQRTDRSLFLEALDQPTPDLRAAYLSIACAGNPELRGQVEAMLAEHFAADGFMAEPAVAPDQTVLATDVPAMEGPGTRIGRYKLLQVIGEGGMGIVYLAEQEEPVRRRVALKIIKLGMDTKNVIARFEAERQALALMDHPNIAKVLDGGATAAGRPYFVMELVRGTKITEYCDEARLSTGERLGLFVKVCQAIQHAHQKGIIHRDIKPSNILVTLHDGVPVPKVIDFGIAKATTDQRLTDKTLFTALEQFIGTPAYMSPEQAELSGLDIDTRSDIYSLGVLLYELLTGKTPFDAQELLASGLDEMRRTIREREPVRPSTRLSTMLEGELTTTAKRRQCDAPKLIHLLRRDVDWIVMKCLEKDRARRYETANGLATDIQRHLNNEAVVARPPSATYRFQKLVRRNKLAVCSAALILAVLLLGVVATTWQAIRATRAGVNEAAQRKLAEAAAVALTRNLYFAEMNLAGQAAMEPGGISQIAELTAKWLPKNGAADQRGWEWYYLRSLPHLDLFTLSGHSNAVQSVAWSPDGKRLASAGKDNAIKLWDADSREEILTLRGHTDVVASLEWTRDGKRLVSGSWDNTVKVWDADGGRNIQTLRGHTGGVNSVAWSSDCKRLASGSSDNTVKVWDADSGGEIRTLTGHAFRVNAVAWSPDGKRLASGSDDATLKVWDVDSRTIIHSIGGPTFPVRSVAWSPDGKRLASAMSSTNDNHTLIVWDANTGTNVHTLFGHIGFVESVAWSPDGKRLASASWDNTVKVWDADSGASLQTLRGHTNDVLAVAWSSDGKRLASGSADGTVKVWDTTREETMTLRGHTNRGVLSLAWRWDGMRLASGSGDRTVKIWDVASGTNILTLPGHAAEVFPVAWSPDGKHLASGSWDDTVKVWDAENGASILTLRGHTGGVMSVSWSPDGARLASAATDGMIKVWDGAGGQQTLNLTGHKTDWVFSVSWSPDGKRLASASGDDGKRLASASADNTLKVWNADSGQEILTLRGHANRVASVAWSPDGKHLASASFDKTVKLWDANSGWGIHTLRGHTATVRCVAWSPNGKRLASASFDKTVKIWDADSGQEILTLRGHSNDVFAISWSPDGRRLASGSVDNTIKIWDARKDYALERE